MTLITPFTPQTQSVAYLGPGVLQGTPGSGSGMLNLSSDSRFLPQPPPEASQAWPSAIRLISAFHEAPQARPSVEAPISPLHPTAASGIAPRIILLFSSTRGLLSGMVSKDPYPSHHANTSPFPIDTQPWVGAADLMGTSHHPPHAAAQPAWKVTGNFTVCPGNSVADTSNYTSHPGQPAQTSSPPALPPNWFLLKPQTHGQTSPPYFHKHRPLIMCLFKLQTVPHLEVAQMT